MCGMGLPKPGRSATVLDNAANEKLLTRALGEKACSSIVRRMGIHPP